MSWEESISLERLLATVDDLWGCIGRGEIAHLQLETVVTAQEVHRRLWQGREEH